MKKMYFAFLTAQLAVLQLKKSETFSSVYKKMIMKHNQKETVLKTVSATLQKAENMRKKPPNQYISMVAINKLQEEIEL